VTSDDPGDVEVSPLVDMLAFRGNEAIVGITTCTPDACDFSEKDLRTASYDADPPVVVQAWRPNAVGEVPENARDLVRSRQCRPGAMDLRFRPESVRVTFGQPGEAFAITRPTSQDRNGSASSDRRGLGHSSRAVAES